MRIAWRTRDEPLAPVAVAATGTAARALAASLSRRSDEQLRELRGVAGDEILVLLAEAEALPWVDGAIYLGRDHEAPSLLLPTMVRPTLALPLVERALLRNAPGKTLAVLPGERVLVPLDDARPVSRTHLARLLEDPS